MAAPSACPLWLLPSLHPPPAIAPRHSAILASANRRRHPGGNRLLRCKRSILGLDNRSALRVRIVAQRGIRMAAAMLVHALWHRVEKPDSVSLEAITSADQFDEILAENQESNTSTVIEWMATWCRKCIYLKPKLEKLAAEYYPNVRFYYVDVNTVPQTLVRRAEVTKMPTIQLWKDGVKKAEVVGGHKAWLVLDEVREMLHST